MRKLLFLVLCILSLSLFACGQKTEEPTDEPTVNPTDLPTDPQQGPSNGNNDTNNYDKTIFTNGDFTYHVVGGYIMDWTPTNTNTMKAVSIADVAVYSTEVADYLTQKNKEYAKGDKPGIKALYMAEDYVLDNQPENASMAPALVKDLSKIGLTLDEIPEANRFDEGNLVALNQGYAIKCVRAYYDEVDENYINDRWISDPKVAHTESLTLDTLFMPKWVELPAEGEEHLGKWDDNPMCIAGAGLYAFLMVEYNVVGTADTPGFGLGLFKIADLIETPMPQE